MTAAAMWLWRTAWVRTLAETLAALAVYHSLNWATGTRSTTAGFALMLAFGAFVEAKRARKDPTP